ncbi:CHAP domain-containing protein [Aurantibacillus circumpalustris]|uniref:CHAP domain-containing protein n=1 Tax=Aurantibacillus circumpalustris TaxID=3036359 RepID=UPI00295AB521|nr:CHAP domain-containing protein [Aurantibacillus circumpalustris]
MAKNMRGAACLLWLFISLCSNGQSNIRAKRQAVIDTALSQVGVREATGKNDGREVEKYLKIVGLGKGYAWCAAFVSWDYKVNRITTFKTAWAPAWFPENRILFKGTVLKINTTPQPGDLGGLWINKRIGHVFIIYAWGDKTVKTIEGNTNEAGSREGDGVYIKRRLRKQIYTVSNWID